ncbi:glycosyltransferase family 4 protein [Owenweeksia hongkongensis]|uniref:glycosyltransferase family 4 protein n=1 Tax=Owenweeksia hongkongensis TaxID=253245 RepID=UPI003A90B925
MKDSSKEKILVLGYFGYETNQLDGQTVKTRNIFSLLKEYIENIDLYFFDTQVFQSSKLNLILMFRKIYKVDTLVYIPAHNNLRFFFPFIYILCRIKNIDIIYVVVGGWLSDFIKDKWILKTFLKRIKVILPQTEALTHNLRQMYGYENVCTLHNFRITDFKPTTPVKRTEPIIRLVFMARVCKMKGIETILELAKKLEKQWGDKSEVIIDFFGTIKSDEEDFFFQKLTETSTANYRGILQPNEIHDRLSEYDVLLLPTRYFTEGLPGSILDAYIAGIPVVVSEWKYAREFVDDGESGLIAEWGNEMDFINKTMDLMDNDELLLKLKFGAHKKSLQYSAQKAATILTEYL